MSILHVEDNDELRETVCELIVAEGRKVLAVRDAEAALGAWKLRSYDLLTTDISLPGITGTERARRVPALHPQQGVAFCSGYEYDRAVTSFGPNVRWIPKAFDVDKHCLLMDEISRVLRNGALRPSRRRRACACSPSGTAWPGAA